MKIFNQNNTELYDIAVDDRSVRYRSIMADDSLTLYFSLAQPVTIPLGAYVDFEGRRYTLFYPENFKKHNTRNFEYTLTLHGNRELLKRFKFKDTASKPYRLKFPLTAKPVDFVTRIVQNMNLHDSGWAVGAYIDAPEKLISFNHESCFDVLGRLAQEFNTEWEIDGKTIHLRKVEKFKDAPLALSYGKGNGFKSGTGRMNDGDKLPIGRLYVQGGERNIDRSKYGSSTLLLPKSSALEYEGKIYRTDADGMYITRDGNTNQSEESFDATNIYPKRVGTVSEVVVVDADKHLYHIKDSSIPEALNYRDTRIAGEKATIVFQSGILAGREFDLEQTDNDLTGYIHAERRFKIIPAEMDGIVMPGGAFVPAVGDKYAIFNIALPAAYIQNDADKSGASWDMFREAVRYFAENETQKFQFTGQLDGVWSKSKWLEIGGKIMPGGHVLFSDPQFLPAGEVIRIIAVKDYVNSPHKPEITLSNAPISGGFAADLGKLEADEVVIEETKKEAIRFAKRQWRDVLETVGMIQDLQLPDFSDSIIPLSVQTMHLLVGSEGLQFQFVNSKTNPVRVDKVPYFITSSKMLSMSAGILQHLTLGIKEISTASAPRTYKFWDMGAYVSLALEPEKAYYLYAKCQKSGTDGTFTLSNSAIGMEKDTNYYHFLVGILNSEVDGDRSFTPMHGYTEITPGRVVTDKITSQSGQTYFDLLNDTIAGKIRFISGSSGLTNLDEWDGVARDIQDAHAAALAADRKAQSAITDAENAVTDFNAKFANMQAQVDGEVTNWFYAYSPTLYNFPTSAWTTSAEKDRHVGDTFTNIQQAPASDAGKSWRFVKNGSTYSWTLIADSDAVKALQEAAKALAAADGKSTTFLVQPTKYQVGDSWFIGSSITLNGINYKAGEILTATASSSSFVASHWVKRVRYTDDSAVDNLEIGGVNLIRNGNFSAGLQEWNIHKTAQQADPEAEVVYTDLPRNATSALRFKAGGSSQGIWQNFVNANKFELNKEYTLSFWLRAETETTVTLLVGHEENPIPINFHATWEKIVIRFTPTMDKNFIFYTTNSARRWFITNIQLEVGSKATPYRNHPYLEKAISGSTDINGGLVLGNILGVKDEKGVVTAGMNGLNVTNKIRFWAGASVQNMAKAPFKVFDNGLIELSNVTSGKEIAIRNEQIENLSNYLGNFDPVKKLDEFYTDFYKEIYYTNDTTFPNLSGATATNPLDTPVKTERAAARTFTLDVDSHIWFVASSFIIAPSEYEGRDILLRIKNAQTGDVIANGELSAYRYDTAQTDTPNSTQSTLELYQRIPAGTYTIECVAALTYAAGRDTDDYYNYDAQGMSSIVIEIRIGEVWAVQNVNKVNLFSDGIVCLGNNDEYFYMRQKALDYFLQVRGSMKLMSKNNRYGIEITDSGLYKYVNGVRSAL